MGFNRNPRYNASGCLDLTTYQAIKNVSREETRADRARVSKLLAEIVKVCDAHGFAVEGRIALRDKRSGKVWR